MQRSRSQRVGPAAGLLAVLLIVVSVAITMSDAPEFLDGADKIASYYADDPGKLLGGFVAHMLGTILLVLFGAAVYVRLGGIRGGTLPPAAFGGAIAMCAMFMLYDVINVALSLRADEDGSVPADTAMLLNDVSGIALGVGGTMFAAVFVGCTAWSALDSGALPRWLAFASFVLVLGLLIPPISWAFLLLLLIWIVAVSIVMWTRPTVADAAAPPPAATTPA